MGGEEKGRERLGMHNMECANIINSCMLEARISWLPAATHSVPDTLAATGFQEGAKCGKVVLPAGQVRVPKNQEDNSWNGQQEYHQGYGAKESEVCEPLLHLVSSFERCGIRHVNC